MTFELVIKQAVSPQKPEKEENQDFSSIKKKAQELLELLIEKTPKDATEDDVISALQRYLNE